MALTYHVLFSECLSSKCSRIRIPDPVTNNHVNQCQASWRNIIVLASTTTPATFIPTTCQAVNLWAAGKRQRVTEAEGVALLCCISGKRVVTSAVRKTRWNTTSSGGSAERFYGWTKVARRCVAPSTEGEKKPKRKEKKHLYKERWECNTYNQALQQEVKKKEKGKKKKKKEKTKQKYNRNKWSSRRWCSTFTRLTQKCWESSESRHCRWKTKKQR